MNVSLEEIELVKRCAAGDQAACTRIFEKYRQDLRFHAKLYISNEEDAIEVISDALCKCLLQIGSFEYRKEGALKAWLITSVGNECVTFLRRTPRYTEEVDEDIPYEDYDEPIEKMTGKEILSVMTLLPMDERQILIMYAFEDATHEEIAARLNISLSNSRVKLFRARKRYVKLYATVYKKELLPWKKN